MVTKSVKKSWLKSAKKKTSLNEKPKESPTSRTMKSIQKMSPRLPAQYPLSRKLEGLVKLSKSCF